MFSVPDVLVNAVPWINNDPLTVIAPLLPVKIPPLNSPILKVNVLFAFIEIVPVYVDLTSIFETVKFRSTVQLLLLHDETKMIVSVLPGILPVLPLQESFAQFAPVLALVPLVGFQ